ncbi:ROK family protein, partial [Mesorhizobium sp. M2D.F.Ca.ET.145.01.1.1]
MAKAVKQAASDTGQVVLSVDIGGSRVKILTSDGGTERRTYSGPNLRPRQMIDKV